MDGGIKVRLDGKKGSIATMRRGTRRGCDSACGAWGSTPEPPYINNLSVYLAKNGINRALYEPKRGVNDWTCGSKQVGKGKKSTQQRQWPAGMYEASADTGDKK